MPHADSSYIPQDIRDKAAFYAHVKESLHALLSSSNSVQCNWVTALSNAASLLYSSYLSCTAVYGHEKAFVNWTGFYLLPKLFPLNTPVDNPDILLLGPFCGRPACQYLSLKPRTSNRKVGVCATAFNQQQTIIVKNVHDTPGHIACDHATNSEIVLPLYIKNQLVGVLDLDSERVGTFDQEDQKGLQSIVQVLNELITL